MKKLLLLSTLFLYLCSAGANNILRMSTTTSTENSGLLSVLNPSFADRHKVRLDVIAVGSGKALRLGENGDVDVVFVHAPKAEMAFVEAGFGVYRKAVMHNDFVIIGPKTDPAKLHIAENIWNALQKISSQQHLFISRGDDSGTHKKEKYLWQAAAINPVGKWYIETGQGMGAVLRMADDKQAYTLVDRGTYIAYQGKIDLQVLTEGDDVLFNPYHIMAVNPKRFAHIQYQLARKYIDYVTGTEGQAIIKAYKIAGQQLFYPDVIR